MKKLITLFLVAMILVCMPGAALAAGVQADASSDVIIRPMLAYIGYADCTLSISASGYANMSAMADCTPSINKIRMVESLQRNEGGSWQTVSSWSQYYYSDSASWTKGTYVSEGYEYRLFCTFYAYYDTTLMESTTRAEYCTY